MPRSGTPAKGRRRTPAARRRAARGAATAAPAPAPSAPARPAAESGAAGGIYRLEGPLLIHDVTARAAELRRALDAGVCSFDLDGVSTIDTAGVQLLLALAEEGARRQRALSLRGGAAVVTEATRALGLATRLVLTTEAS